MVNWVNNPQCGLTQEVFDPKTGGVCKSYVRQFGQRSVWEDGFKRRVEVYEESCIAPLLLQVGQHSMESRTVSSVDLLSV